MSVMERLYCIWPKVCPYVITWLISWTGFSLSMCTLSFVRLVQDKLGLKVLNEAGRIKFVEAPFNHLQFTEEWFFDNLLPYINVTFSNVREPVMTFWWAWNSQPSCISYFSSLSLSPPLSMITCLCASLYQWFVECTCITNSDSFSISIHWPWWWWMCSCN